MTCSLPAAVGRGGASGAAVVRAALCGPPVRAPRSAEAILLGVGVILGCLFVTRALRGLALRPRVYLPGALPLLAYSLCNYLRVSL